ncbi:MAG: 50S ribosomal protein L10 [Leptospiraceae bacterium]|nr:50S ribosomal protein L10 [Leptospiraceae bacterium]MCP5511675.1 50S ribosomal protein L10 [Leptospiraceae bacterium]
MAQPEKIEAVADLKVKLEEKPNFILVSYSGLNVKLMEELRMKLRDSDSRLKVIKNNLFLRALKESKLHSEKDIKFGSGYFGPMAVIFSDENLPSIAKICKDFKKDNPVFDFKAGYFSGDVLDSNGVESIAGLPSREELLAIIARGINTPATKIATGINQVMASLARAIQATAEKNGK